MLVLRKNILLTQIFNHWGPLFSIKFEAKTWMKYVLRSSFGRQLVLYEEQIGFI